jgi:hypothetical protein
MQKIQLPAHTLLGGQVMHRASPAAVQANSWGDAPCITLSRYGLAPSDARCITAALWPATAKLGGPPVSLLSP